MKVVGLVSGGKDSFFHLMNCIANGHELVAIANLMPARELNGQDIDSYMFQTVGYDAIDLYSQCLDVPLFRRSISGNSVELGTSYTINKKDEVEDLFELLKTVKEHIPDVQGVASGAILSGYQRVRIENVCQRLGLTPLAYLWQRDQDELLQEMIDFDVNAILVKVAGEGLNSTHLGRSIKEMQPTLRKLASQYGTHICGEGGEYETLVLSCPLFKSQLVIKKSETHLENENDPHGFGFLQFTELAVEPYDAQSDWLKRLQDLIVKRSMPKLSPETLRCMSLISKVDSEEYHIHDSASKSAMTPSGAHIYHRGEYFAISAVSIPNSGLSFSEETKAVLEKMQALLSESFPRGNLQQASMLHVFVKNMSDFGMLNTVYGDFFGQNPPARVTVQAPLQNCQIQIDAYGYAGIPDSPLLQNLHVQSLSYWAPANIGPYSQAVQVLDHIYLSGQIGLVPETMSLPPPYPCPSDLDLPVELRQLLSEALYSFRSVCNVANVMGSNLQEQVIGTIVYLSNEVHRYMNVVKEITFFNEMSKTLPMLVVVVPGLPRNAMIEWEVLTGSPKGLYAVKQSEDMDDNDDDDQDDKVVSFSSERIMVQKYGRFSFGIWHGASHSSLAKPVTCEEIEKAFIEYFHQLRCMMEKVEHDMLNGIYAFRVFYHHSYSTLRISEVFSRALSNSSLWNAKDAKLPAISVVPVLALDRNALVAIAFQSSWTKLTLSKRVDSLCIS